jgi:hypothetical protein
VLGQEQLLPTEKLLPKVCRWLPPAWPLLPCLGIHPDTRNAHRHTSCAHDACGAHIEKATPTEEYEANFAILLKLPSCAISLKRHHTSLHFVRVQRCLQPLSASTNVPADRCRLYR